MRIGVAGNTRNLEEASCGFALKFWQSRQYQTTRWLLFFCVVMLSLCAANTVYAQATSQLSNDFWAAEKSFQQSYSSSSGKLPLAPHTALSKKFTDIESVANANLEHNDPQKPRLLPLYFGGMAAYTIGDYETAEKYFWELLQNKTLPLDAKSTFINKADIAMLYFYAKTTEQAQKNQDSLARLRLFTKAALQALTLQKEWEAQNPHSALAHSRPPHSLKNDPTAFRVAMLPNMQQLVRSGWETRYAAAVIEHGGPAVFDYLTNLPSKDPLISQLVTPHLNALSLNVNQYYINKADTLARAAKGKDQNAKVAALYKMAYQLDPDGKDADYALYHWAKALGGTGDVRQEISLLKKHLEKFPQSELRAQTMHLLGVSYCNPPLREIDKGLPWLLRVAKDFPQSYMAPKSLSAATLYLTGKGDYTKAIDTQKLIQTKYPKSNAGRSAENNIAQIRKMQQANSNQN